MTNVGRESWGRLLGRHGGREGGGGSSGYVSPTTGWNRRGGCTTHWHHRHACHSSACRHWCHPTGHAHGWLGPLHTGLYPRTNGWHSRMQRLCHICRNSCTHALRDPDWSACTHPRSCECCPHPHTTHTTHCHTAHTTHRHTAHSRLGQRRRGYGGGSRSLHHTSGS